MSARVLMAGLIIVVTLVGVAIGRYPWLKMNRATIALVGATLLHFARRHRWIEAGPADRTEKVLVQLKAKIGFAG